jgi:hypothetical protein
MRTTQYADEDMAELNRLSRSIRAGMDRSARLRREFNTRYDPGQVYVVLYDSGVVKVGKSRSAPDRLRAHDKTGNVTASWASGRHLDHSATERALVAYCNQRGVIHGGREYFRELQFDDVVARAQQLVEHAVTPEIARSVSDEGLAAARSTYRAYLDELIDAVDGDLSQTWQHALDRLAEARPAGEAS